MKSIIRAIVSWAFKEHTEQTQKEGITIRRRSSKSSKEEMDTIYKEHANSISFNVATVEGGLIVNVQHFYAEDFMGNGPSSSQRLKDTVSILRDAEDLPDFISRVLVSAKLKGF